MPRCGGDGDALTDGPARVTLHKPDLHAEAVAPATRRRRRRSPSAAATSSSHTNTPTVPLPLRPFLDSVSPAVFLSTGGRSGDRSFGGRGDSGGRGFRPALRQRRGRPREGLRRAERPSVAQTRRRLHRQGQGRCALHQELLLQPLRTKVLIDFSGCFPWIYLIGVSILLEE